MCYKLTSYNARYRLLQNPKSIINNLIDGDLGEIRIILTST